MLMLVFSGVKALKMFNLVNCIYTAINSNIEFKI